MPIFVRAPGTGSSILKPGKISDTNLNSPESPNGVQTALASDGRYPAPANALLRFLAIDLGADISATTSGKPNWSLALPFSEQFGISCAVRNTLAPVPPA